MDEASGANLTDSRHITLEVTVSGHTSASGGEDSRCRAWTEVFNRNDGLFIVRYKLHLACEKLRIVVTSGGRMLAERMVVETSWPDFCNCPGPSLQVRYGYPVPTY